MKNKSVSIHLFLLGRPVERGDASPSHASRHRAGRASRGRVVGGRSRQELRTDRYVGRASCFSYCGNRVLLDRHLL